MPTTTYHTGVLERDDDGFMKKKKYGRCIGCCKCFGYSISLVVVVLAIIVGVAMASTEAIDTFDRFLDHVQGGQGYNVYYYCNILCCYSSAIMHHTVLARKNHLAQ